MAAGEIIQGVRWLRDAAGKLVGYRNPVTDKDEDVLTAAQVAATQSLVSGAGNQPSKLTALVATVPNDMPPELKPLDWHPDRFLYADATYLYGYSSSNALDFVRLTHADRTRVVTANPFGTASPRYLRTVWASPTTPGLLLAAVGEPSQTAASMVIHRSTNYGATWAAVLTLGTGAGGTINGVWALGYSSFVEYNGALYCAEYNVNSARTDGGANDLLTLWRSNDAGLTWAPALRWNQGVHTVRHMHAIKVVGSKLLICTGDSNAESAMLLWDGVTDISNTAWSALPANIPVQYGRQTNRAADVEEWGGYLWWMADGPTADQSSIADVGWFRQPVDMSTPPKRLDGKISAIPYREGTWAANFSTGAACYIEETAQTLASEFTLGVWVTNEQRTRIERAGVLRFNSNATGSFIPVMFQAGDTVFVSWSGYGIGKPTIGTVSFTVHPTKRWCGIRPDAIHPVYWVDPVNGTDDATSERGWRPSLPWKTLKYAMESNRCAEGGRLMLPAGDFNESIATLIAVNADRTNVEAGQYLTVEGEGMDLTKHSAAADTVATKTFGLGTDAGAGFEFKDIHLSTRKEGSMQAIIDGSGAANAQRLRAIRARIGGHDIAANLQNCVLNANLSAGGSIQFDWYDSQAVANYVGAGYLITGDADAPVHINFIRSVSDGGRGLCNPLSSDAIYAEDSLFANYSVTAIRSGAAATKVPTLKRCKFSAGTPSGSPLPQYITDNAGLTGAGQFTAAKSTTTLTPAAFFDSASAVDATVAPRDPRAFDFTAST